MADRAPATDRIGRHNADERRLLQKSHFQVEFLRPVFRWHVTVTGPDDVLNVQTVFLPRMPITNLQPQKKCNKKIVAWRMERMFQIGKGFGERWMLLTCFHLSSFPDPPLLPGCKFTIFNSTELRVPSASNSNSGRPESTSIRTFCRYLEEWRQQSNEKRIIKTCIRYCPGCKHTRAAEQRSSNARRLKLVQLEVPEFFRWLGKKRIPPVWNLVQYNDYTLLERIKIVFSLSARVLKSSRV